MLAFVLGVCLVGIWSGLPDWTWPAAVAATLLSSGFLIGRLHTRFTGNAALCPGPVAESPTGCWLTRVGILLALTGWLTTGVTWHVLVAQQRLDQRLPARLEGQDLLVSGYVSSIPEQQPGRQRFRFVIENGPAGVAGRQVLLSEYGAQPFRAGQMWQLVVRLQRPHGSANPGTFDYEAWLFQQRIAARGYVRDSPENQYRHQQRRTLASLRQALRDRLQLASAGLRNQSLFLALTLGERGALSGPDRDLYASTGTSHLVVISGLHVALVAGFCALLAGRLWRLSRLLVNLFPAPRVAALMALAGALLYSLLAGFGLPTQRALVMVSVFMSLRLLGLHGAPAVSLLQAALLVLLRDPIAVISAGFWLSFSAVAALLLVANGLPREPGGQVSLAWRNLLAPQLAVLIGLLVPLGFWIGSVALLAPLANLIAIPLVSWVLIPLCLGASVMSIVWTPAARIVFQLADLVASLLLTWLHWVAGLTALGSWPVAGGSGVLLVAAAIGSLLLLIPGSGHYRLLGCLLVLPYLAPVKNPTPGVGLAVHVLDVGQGLAVVVRTASHTLVYDTGPRYPSGFDSGAALLVPVLQRLGVTRLDRLLVSHGDNDHAGGVGGLLRQFPVVEVLAGEALESVPVPVRLCSRGQRWNWDGVQFTILHPPASEPRQGNNSSCVLEIRAGDYSVLLPGDVEAEAERRLLTSDPGLAPIDLLVSAHHGSTTSSSWAFLAATRPRLVIHSAGYHNRFGHPALPIQERIQTLGGRQLLTARQGMISVYFHGDSPDFRVESWRQVSRRYWNRSDIPARADTSTEMSRPAALPP
ncbi:MAG: DNA internalization-related competence protein ComEC/Rec2 [Gammaproteobacteria bacterium]|nr:DNA internalization-related competence protein ComEC/Rec2 [Pseudomonadales bacterium]MCP5346098.1 DNA internalization-related competence protein ComEC/Rec2 [Pseudomonadales bacterium]